MVGAGVVILQCSPFGKYMALSGACFPMESNDPRMQLVKHFQLRPDMKLSFNAPSSITGGTSRHRPGARAPAARARQYVVIVTGRDAATPRRGAARAVPGLQGIVSDVADDDGDRRASTTRSLARFPALDVLVNNAGVMRNLDLTRERTLADVTREIDVNLRGPLQMIQQFLPHLRTRARGGHRQRRPRAWPSCRWRSRPSTARPRPALHAYTRALRVQLAGSGGAGVRDRPAAGRDRA